jgi:hypothetical protein
MEKILPERIDNIFRGNRFSAIAFLLLTVISVARSLIHVFAPDGGAQSIATIDLNVEGASTIIGIFAQWGLSQLLMAGFFLVVYVRYKSLIPLMYILIIVENAARIVVGFLKPIETLGTAPGGIGSLLIVPLAILLFVFSIREPDLDGSPKDP